MFTKEDFETIVWECSFQNYEFYIGQSGYLIFLQVHCDGRNNVTGEPERWYGRPWILSPDMTRSQVVQTAFKAVMTALEHEARECFLYAGRTIFDPHLDVDKLWTLRGSEEDSLGA